MDMVKPFSRRIFGWSFIFMMILAASFNIIFYFASLFLANILPAHVIKEAAAHSNAFKNGMDTLLPIIDILQNFYLPVISVFFVVFTLIFWLFLRSSIARLIRKSGVPDAMTQASAKKETKASSVDTDAEPLITKKEMAESNKRFYLHLLSVLQREGRLIDFLAEDLNAYEDAQIGAAVRSIQDNCKNALKKYLNPKPVIDQEEASSITLAPNFDPNTIKLTGNVSGEPPFQGTLRHKGWRASRLELPTLAAVTDPTILSPAEVEIL